MKSWLCAGDFNEIMNLDEKCGSLEGSVRRILDFNEVVNSCKLIDLGYKGVTTHAMTIGLLRRISKKNLIGVWLILLGWIGFEATQ
jgi:hypothetical protein